MPTCIQRYLVFPNGKDCILGRATYQALGNVECRLINSIMGGGLINKITGLGDFEN